MNKSEILKNEILSQYKSVRKFALEMDIPYSTLATALDGKLEGMAYGTVLRMCDKLKINPIDFSPLSKATKINRILNDNKIYHYYNRLNQPGRDKALEIMDDLSQIPKYTD